MLIAFDTETTLIADRAEIASSTGEGIATKPFETPTLVLGSVAADTGERWLLPPAALAVELAARLRDPRVEVVGHNLVFDIDATSKYAPFLRPLFYAAAQEGRLHDTMLLDYLLRLAVGRFDRSEFNKFTRTWSLTQATVRGLKALAWEYLGVELDKDPNVRLGYGKYLGVDPEELPKAFRDYAIADADATLRVYQHLLKGLEQIGAKDFLGEALQVRTSLVVSAMDRVGIAVDQGLAGQLEAEFREEQKPLTVQLVNAGLGRWERGETISKERHDGAPPEPSPPDGEWVLHPETHTITKHRVFKKHYTIETAQPRFHLLTRAVQDRLAPYVEGDDEAPERDDGTLSLEADYWELNAPAADTAIQAWLRHEKLKKVLSTYLAVYAKTPTVFPRWRVLGARSGRMSCTRPNLQNIPKRKAGIRALFVAHPGYLLTKADYSAQELVTLAEIIAHLKIPEGPLGAVIRSGQDIHRLGAAHILKKLPEDVTKAERQAQKALHFGVPGGLGPKKLAAYAHGGYGVAWTTEQAARARQDFLDAYPDIAAYLSHMKKSQDECLMAATGYGADHWKQALKFDGWNIIRAMILHADPGIRNQGMLAERQHDVRLPGGRRRTGCRMTEAANSYFQGLAADVTKEAMWRCHIAGLRIVMVIHDEIVIESRPENVEAEARTLEACMRGAFQTICPRYGHFAKVEVEAGLTRWGAATDLFGKELTLGYEMVK